MFVFYSRQRVWPNKTRSMLRSSMMGTNPLISNLEDMNHCAHRPASFTQWLPWTSIYNAAQQQWKKKKKSWPEFTASEESIVELHISNAPHRDFNSLLCDQGASTSRYTSGCARSLLCELVVQQNHINHTAGGDVCVVFCCFVLFSVKQVNENHLLYDSSRGCWK